MLNQVGSGLIMLNQVGDALPMRRRDHNAAAALQPGPAGGIGLGFRVLGLRTWHLSVGPASGIGPRREQRDTQRVV
jgi:hypothetical protein